MSVRALQTFDLLLQFEFLSLQLSQPGGVSQGPGQFVVDGAVEISVTISEFADPSIDGHEGISSSR
jgi:hypothetical protein